MNLSPSLADVILAAMDARLQGVWTAMPGRVVDYNATEQSVTVQPTVQTAYESEAGDRVAESLPQLVRCPVMSFGGGGFRTVYPVAAGDTCLVVFCSCSVDRWLANGGSNVDPGDDRRFTLSDAVALVGLRDFAHALKSAPTSTMSAGYDGGPTIEYGKAKIQVGGPSGTSPIVVQSALDDFMVALTAAIAALTASSDPSASALTALQTQLQSLNVSTGWKSRTSVAEAK